MLEWVCPSGIRSWGSQRQNNRLTQFWIETPEHIKYMWQAGKPPSSSSSSSSSSCSKKKEGDTQQEMNVSTNQATQAEEEEGKEGEEGKREEEEEEEQGEEEGEGEGEGVLNRWVISRAVEHKHPGRRKGRAQRVWGSLKDLVGAGSNQPFDKEVALIDGGYVSSVTLRHVDQQKLDTGKYHHDSKLTTRTYWSEREESMEQHYESAQCSPHSFINRVELIPDQDNQGLVLLKFYATAVNYSSDDDPSDGLDFGDEMDGDDNVDNDDNGKKKNKSTHHHHSLEPGAADSHSLVSNTTATVNTMQRTMYSTMARLNVIRSHWISDMRSRVLKTFDESDFVPLLKAVIFAIVFFSALTYLFKRLFIRNSPSIKEEEEEE